MLLLFLNIMNTIQVSAAAAAAPVAAAAAPAAADDDHDHDQYQQQQQKEQQQQHIYIIPLNYASTENISDNVSKLTMQVNRVYDPVRVASLLQKTTQSYDVMLTLTTL